MHIMHKSSSLAAGSAARSVAFFVASSFNLRKEQRREFGNAQRPQIQYCTAFRLVPKSAQQVSQLTSRLVHERFVCVPHVLCDLVPR